MTHPILEKKMDKTIRASFDPKYLRCLLPFMAVGDIRYYLNGICIEKAKDGGVYLIATDGHTMSVVHDATGTFESNDEAANRLTFRVGDGLASAATKAGKKASKGYKVLIDGPRLKIACDLGSTGEDELFVQAGDSLVDGVFPHWQRVTPDLGKLKPGCLTDGNALNVDYLARLAKLSTGKRFRGVSLWQEDDNKAVVARLPNIPEMLVIFMPMRDGEKDPVSAFKGFPFQKPKTEAAELEAA